MQAIFIPCNATDVAEVLEMMDGFGKNITIFRNHKPSKKRKIVFIRICLSNDREKLLAKAYEYDHRIGESGQKPKDVYK